MLKLLIWKLPRPCVSFVIFLHKPSSQRSHNDWQSHCCHLPEACSSNVNTIFYGAVKKIPNCSLLTLQGEPKTAPNLECGQRATQSSFISTPPMAKLPCQRLFWLYNSSPPPTSISHCLHINGKPFKFIRKT